MKPTFVALLAGMVGFAFVLPSPAAEAVTYKEKVLYSFCNQQNCKDGANPAGSLIDVNGILYGTTTTGGGTGCGGGGCGTVFSIDPSTGAETVLYSFLGGSDGAGPVPGVIAVNGKLYGTTENGGGTGCSGGGCGTVFSLDPSTGAERVLYSFCSQQNCVDGANPVAGLIAVNGALYGTTVEGGNDDGTGTAFAVDRKTGAEAMLYSFCSQQNCADGRYPYAALINVKGTLYGTTEAGGGTGWGGDGGGMVFWFDPSTGAEKMLYSFSGTDGANPVASLIDMKSSLYGVTGGGGAGCNGSGCGTVFSLDPSSGVEKLIYSFCSRQNCSDGKYPRSSLLPVNGKLYGATEYGGIAGCAGSGCGTVFALEKKQ